MLPRIRYQSSLHSVPETSCRSEVACWTRSDACFVHVEVVSSPLECAAFATGFFVPFAAGIRRYTAPVPIIPNALRRLPLAECRWCRKSTLRSPQAWRGDKCAQRATVAGDTCPCLVSSRNPNVAAPALCRSPFMTSRVVDSRSAVGRARTERSRPGTGHAQSL